MNNESMQDQLQALQNKVAKLEAAAAQPASRNKKRSRLTRVALAAALFLIPVVAFGVTITKPYTFVSGQPISASELNANFDTVYDRVNELGVYKVKVGSTVMGDAVRIIAGKYASFITDEGYVTAIAELQAGSVFFAEQATFTYHLLSDCSDAPIVQYHQTKTVLNTDGTSTNLVYGTGTNPGSVPGYLKSFSGCQVNFNAGTQSTLDFTTTAANDESITGVPNSISGAVSISLE